MEENLITARSNKVAALAPFALAVAEAHAARVDWLGKVKEMRRKSHAVTHEAYAVTYKGYVNAKHKLREAVAEYKRAQSEFHNGQTTVLKPEWREWLGMRGLEF